VPQPVQPQPTPFTVDLADVRAPDGTDIARIEIKTVTGSTVIFMDPSGERQLAGQLADHAATLACRPIIATAMPVLAVPAPGGRR